MSSVTTVRSQTLRNGRTDGELAECSQVLSVKASLVVMKEHPERPYCDAFAFYWSGDGFHDLAAQAGKVRCSKQDA